MFARRIAVVGAGYVGLTTAACLASLGHRVVCADVDAGKVAKLRRLEVDILEEGLPELVAEGVAAGRLEFVVGASGVFQCPDQVEVLFLCVPTPMSPTGAADLSAIESVLSEIGDQLAPGTVVVNKSTVPVGTAALAERLLGRADVTVVSNPEFLREGTAVHDFLHPDRIVVGASDQNAAERVAALYSRLGAPLVLTDAQSAELTKYAANCFLAMKLSYVNAIAELCEQLGADVADVTEGMGYDHRIGQAFLRPGPGWGGSCLPKDTMALEQVAASSGVDFSLLRATITTNERQFDLVVAKAREACGGELEGARIGLLGLAFKAGTGDLRSSPALIVARRLVQEGATVVAYDPQVPLAVLGVTDGIDVVADARSAAKDASALMLLTEWPEFRTQDWTEIASLLSGTTVVDTRNHLDPEVLERAGLDWRGVGLGR
ncbi:UDP-glucose 6-dehydrogenase [Lentzea pudingi]|uniref:UDP-glucose 6-dehydrogenase n=1 Tax=Lentzea pudingi TaxID=1789439 RepID=A0ABQ2HSG7_9PSEU|nr:UDP-glucose/GDP-mannose dehydrogenase family protein [Lentzea pudingi]GGM89453.1 UDP-glucose 6-dehydrogenase [Lentzea pudingi]